MRVASVQTDGKDGARVNLCPWETDPPEKTAAAKMVSQGPERPADVCPWDSGEPESGKPQTPKTPESHVRQDTARANVCPWDTEEAGAVKAEVSKASAKIQRQGSSQEDVCPWETEEPKVLKKQDSAQERCLSMGDRRTKSSQKAR